MKTKSLHSKNKIKKSGKAGSERAGSASKGGGYSSPSFPYHLDFKKIDFRKKPELYVVGVGEQGVLMVEPYKSEILPYWRFKTPDIATKSAKKIYALFRAYKKQGDFIGMDMARKFLQMGFTRARRYANHASGRKYETAPRGDAKKVKGAKKSAARVPATRAKATRKVRAQESDWKTSPKAESARIFYEYYEKAKSDEQYISMKSEWGK